MGRQLSGISALIDYSTAEKMNEYDDRIRSEYENVRMMEPVVTAAVKEMTEELGTGLMGLEYSVKTYSSVCNKLDRIKTENKYTDSYSDFDKMADKLRYTEICDHEDIVPCTRATIDAMEEKGYMLSKIKNYYANPYEGTDYRGMHLCFISPFGEEIELQVHSKESFEAKMKGHTLYEKIRVAVDQQEKDILIAQIKEIHQTVSMPSGYETINDFKYRDIEQRKNERMQRTGLNLDKQEEKTENGTSIIYHITDEGKMLFEGFENHYSDNSIECYRYDAGKGETIRYAVTPAGQLSVYDGCPRLPIEMGIVQQYFNTKEKSHKEWLEVNSIKDVEVLEAADGREGPSEQKFREDALETELI